MNERGHTLLELLIAIAILAVGASWLIPGLRAYSQEVQLMGAAQVFKGRFRLAQSAALRRGVETAIRFGRSNMLSCSPMGTATPGTFYLAGESAQAAVRVTPGTARVRILFCRGRRWVER